ncbi:restriction endonuclease subunit S [Mordavella massiliensis]|uniref:Restriction endonuclease subunit S n=1 Tax=Mordavella massiliensis TaxID=1871024 RepID=A0A939BHT7_9CLOT|nr:restriction endonuclease subunit S [Mordavella massiliensis]MBM6949419.1 restriction endonuclease subunit S [Mordavella massiliensis]
MEYIKLCDICDFQGGSQPPKNEWSFDLKAGYIRMLQIRDFTQSEKVTPEYIKVTKTTKICEADDILIARYGASLGKILTGLAGAYNVAIMRAIPNENVLEKRYLYYYLKSPVFQGFLLNVGSRAAQAGFNKNDLQDLLIPNISKRKQLEIVRILERVEFVIEVRRQELEKLDDFIKARFIEMFGEPENNNKAWPVKSLDKLCTVGSSKRVYQSEQSSEGVPFWRISDLVSKIDTGTVDSELFISEIKYTELKRAGLVPVTGDILVTSRGTLGRCYIVHDEDCFYFQDGMISWLTNYSEEITPLYLQYLFTMSGFRKQIDNAQAGSTVAYLSIAMLKKLQVMVPNKALQEQFAAFVEQVDKSKVAVQKAIDETQLLFDSLMQKYFG